MSTGNEGPFMPNTYDSRPAATLMVRCPVALYGVKPRCVRCASWPYSVEVMPCRAEGGHPRGMCAPGQSWQAWIAAARAHTHHKHAGLCEVPRLVPGVGLPNRFSRAFQQHALLRVHQERLVIRGGKGGRIKKINIVHEDREPAARRRRSTSGTHHIGEKGTALAGSGQR